MNTSFGSLGFQESTRRNAVPQTHSPGASLKIMTVSASGNVDIPPLEQMDPSTASGYAVIFDRECPAELCHGSVYSKDDATPERIRVKILGNTEHPEYIKAEITTETDLFFHFVHLCTVESFKEMKKQQKLSMEFSEYAKVLIKMINSCIKNPQTFVLVFRHLHTRFLAVIMVLRSEREGLAPVITLSFMQNAGYKLLELLSLNFMSENGEEIRQHIHFRYNSVKFRFHQLHQHYNELVSLVKLKNPSILLTLQKQNKQ